VEPKAAAELKALLVGVPLPAEKPELLEYAVSNRAQPQLLDALRSLPEREQFRSLDEVIEELLRMEPPREKPVPHEPKDESGLPPGGDDYTRAHPPDTGAVRDNG
jgi:Protein of unknown function (DUF2795)